jgi:hypothetical protein
MALIYTHTYLVFSIDIILLNFATPIGYWARCHLDLDLYDQIVRIRQQ